MYIDGSFVKHKIPVKHIYVTVRILNSEVSGTACAWRVLSMMPSILKSATLLQTETWRKDCRLRLHHACIAQVVDMINRFGSEDKYLHRGAILCKLSTKFTQVYTGLLMSKLFGNFR